MQEKTKKGLTIAGRIASWVLIVFTVFIMIFTIVSVRAQKQGVFGYRASIVLTDSMSGTFEAGDLIFTKEVKDVSKLKKDDIITFISQGGESEGKIVTHAIYDVAVKDNTYEIYTYGKKTGAIDKDEHGNPIAVPSYAIIGQYQGHIPNMGHFFQFLKSTPGYIVCILLPFSALIIYQGVNCVRIFLKYRKEQTAEMDAERAKIEADREEAQRVLKELEQLKAQLAASNLVAPTAAATESDVTTPKEDTDS